MKIKEENKITPLPQGQIWSVCFIQITEGMNTNVLFPFLAFMTEDFGYTGHRLGIYAGMLAATFSGAQFCSSILWGIISDKYGRKFALLSGVFGAAIGMVIFGTAKTYFQAIIGRALCGFLSGNLGIIKSFLTEFTDKTNRSKAFSMWSLASTCGNIVGPLLGGYLCRPTEKFPTYFSQDGIFGIYPYFLPCLVVVLLDVLTSIFCFFAMTETRISIDNTSISSLSLDDSIHDINNDSSNSNNNIKNPNSPLTWIAKHFSYNQVNNGEYRSVAIDSRDEDGGIAMRVLELEKIASRARNGSIDDQMKFDQHITTTSLLELVDEDENENNISHNDIDQEDNIQSIQYNEEDNDNIDNNSNNKNKKNSILWNPKVIFSTGSYGILAMAFILLDETIPLLLKQDINEGGMSFTSSQIGTLLSISGGALLIFSSFFLSKMCSGSKLKLYKNYTLIALPIILGFPIVAYVNQKYFSKFSEHISSILLWISLLSVYTIRNILATLSFSGIIMLINNSAPEKDLGLVNGLGQSLASAARCIGPAIGGALWSLSVRTHFIFLNFIFVQFLLIGAVIIGSYLPVEIDYGDDVEVINNNSLGEKYSKVPTNSEINEEDLDNESLSKLSENCGTP